MKKPPKPPSGKTYTVGKGKPPNEHKFKPGQSGNPKGRPKGSRNLATLAREALERLITVTDGGVRRKISTNQLAMRRIADKAAAGDIKSHQYLAVTAGHLQPEAFDAADLTAQDEALLEAALARRAKSRG